MKKKEAIAHIKSKVGYVPSIMIFEIYSDEDEIPQGVIDHLITSVSKPRKHVIYCGSKFAKQIQDNFKKSYSNK